jgi:hypothetical protein
MPITKSKPKPSEVYVCRESFASHEHSVARGMRLRGSHPAVQAHPDFFLVAATATEEDLAPLNPSPQEEPERELGRVKVRILRPRGKPTSRAVAVVGAREYHGGEVVEVDGRAAEHLVDAGIAEIVKKLGPKKAKEAC